MRMLNEMAACILNGMVACMLNLGALTPGALHCRGHERRGSHDSGETAS